LTENTLDSTLANQPADRIAGPPEQTIDHIQMIPAESRPLDNGWPCFFVDAGTQDVVRIECSFNAGSACQTKSLVANSVSTLLNGGTSKRTAYELAETLDNYGAFLQTDMDEDFSAMEVYTPNKHLENMVPLIHEVLFDSVHPASEFELHRSNSQQKFVVNDAKVNYQARRHFSGLIFGVDHPYGKRASVSSFDELTHQDIIDFYEAKYRPENSYFVIAGKIDDKLFDLLNKYFGQMPREESTAAVEIGPPTPTGEQKLFIEQPDAVQSAVRIGRTLFSKTHKDFLGMQVLNTLLGGYFSSRLMQNIREDKGYTYGIGSGLISLLHGGYFFIGTEVGSEVREAAVAEIYKEIARLRDELVEEEELNLVRNYLLGSLMRNADGPFALADRFSGLHRFGLGYEFYDRFVETVKTITPAEIQRLAQTWLQEADLKEVVVGR
jgi:zinc protease